MKKQHTSLLCLVMAFMLMLSLCACAATEAPVKTGPATKPTDATQAQTTPPTQAPTQAPTVAPTEAPKADTLVGQWSAQIDMTDMFNSMLTESMGFEVKMDSFVMIMNAEFNEDGTTIMEIDKDHLEEQIEDLADFLWDLVIEMYAKELEMKESEVEKLLKDEGLTKDTLIESMDLSSIGDNLSQEGYWLLEDDKLYIAEDKDDLKDSDPADIELDGDTFSITGGAEFDEENKEMMEAFLPLVFERV